MSRFRKWLAEVGRRLLAGKSGPVPALRVSVPDPDTALLTIRVHDADGDRYGAINIVDGKVVYGGNLPIVEFKRHCDSCLPYGMGMHWPSRFIQAS